MGARLSITTSSYEIRSLFRALLKTNTKVNIRHIHLISLLRKQLMKQKSLTTTRYILSCFTALKGLQYTHIQTERYKERKESHAAHHMKLTHSSFLFIQNKLSKTINYTELWIARFFPSFLSNAPLALHHFPILNLQLYILVLPLNRYVTLGKLLASVSSSVN